MIATRDQYRAFRRFGKFQIQVPAATRPDGSVEACPYKHGKTYAVQQAAGRKAKLRGRVSVERNGDWWDITFTLAEDEDVRMMAADSSRGYTDQNVHAMPREPEAVSAEYQQALTDIAREQNRQIKREKIAELRAGIDSASGGLDTLTRRERRHMAEIDHHLTQLEQLIKEAA